MKLRVNEIYQTFSGEGPNVGDMTTFVRFGSCNLRCPGWGVTTTLPSGEEVVGCDTPHAVFPELYKNDPKHTPEEVVGLIPLWPDRVTITGGEPFMQTTSELSGLVSRLLDRGHVIDVFTNGTLSYLPSKSWVTDSRVTMCVDFKLPSSGEYGKFLFENLECLSLKDEIKFVCGDRHDYETALETAIHLKRGDSTVRVSLGVVFGKLEPSKLVEWILHDKLPVRLNLQTHQLIGVNESERNWHYT